MEIIPVINCPDSKCVKEKLSILKEQLPETEWIHIDISDGKFSPVKTWNNPEELKLEIGSWKLEIDIEVHLMVERPEDEAGKWLAAGAKRLIIHLEALQKTSRPNALESIIEKCSEYSAEVMLAINPETPVEELFPYVQFLFAVQFLAVSPGPSGQKFNKAILEKIQVMRERVPDIQIEVDGGINPETAKKVGEAGADVIVSGWYIFESDDPGKAYRDLASAIAL